VVRLWCQNAITERSPTEENARKLQGTRDNPRPCSELKPEGRGFESRSRYSNSACMQALFSF